VTVPKDSVDQGRAEMLKTIRALVRLKHSLEADRELNEVLPRAESFYNKKVQLGQLPSPADVRKAVGV